MFPRLLLLFLAIPLVELYLFLTVGSEIGLLPTLAVIFLTGVAGAALARAQGLKALARYRETMAAGRVPHETVIEGLLIFVAGALLLLPGFFTDLVGFLLLLPPVRRLAQHRLEASLRDRFRVVSTSTGGAPPPQRQARDGGDVINVEAEVVESHAHRAHRNGAGNS